MAELIFIELPKQCLAQKLDILNFELDDDTFNNILCIMKSIGEVVEASEASAQFDLLEKKIAAVLGRVFAYKTIADEAKQLA